MKTISRREVEQKTQQEDRVALVEVLGSEYYDKFHLPGAINVPIDEEFSDRVQQALPDKQKPVIVYCLDQACQASPKAARKLEELGYQEVYDYEAGKVDWQAAGLPVE